MAGRKPAGIEASSDPGVRLAELCDFLPAAMRRYERVCHADVVSVRCLIVDDNYGFLEAARSLLEREGLTVVGVASTSAEAVRNVELLRPDVVLVDVSLGKESGFELARRLRGVTVILISTASVADFAELVARSPAAGFLSKSELSAEGIRGFLDGQRASR
jgi:DNA-binding NarL/FixJ family response regulator